MRLPKQSGPSFRRRTTSLTVGSGRGISAQGLLPSFICEALCAAGAAACVAAGVPAPVCAIAHAACNAAC